MNFIPTRNDLFILGKTQHNSFSGVIFLGQKSNSQETKLFSYESCLSGDTLLNNTRAFYLLWWYL